MKRFILICIVWCGAITVWAQPVAEWVIFGDSLSDNGNSYEYSHHQKPPKAMYYRGRYSNGPIWVDYVHDHFAHQKVQPLFLNYAFGGAGVLHSQGQAFTLSQEIDSYLLSHKTSPKSDTRFVVWIGANDYLLHPDAAPSTTNKIIMAIQNNILRLVRHGAQHIIIIGLPDLGYSPFAQDLELQQPLSALSQRHNVLLQQRVKQLQDRFPKIDWQYVDANHIFAHLRSQPKQYGLTYPLERCMDPSKPIRRHSCLQYVFFDQFHPTTRIHKIFAQYFLKRVHAPSLK